MADDGDQQAAGGRPVLLIGLLALVVSATVAFGRVFEDNGTTVRLVLGGVAALGLAAALERRHVAVAALASVAGFALLSTWLLYPDTTWYGLPTLATWDEFVRTLVAVGRTAEAHIAPAPTLEPLLLASLASVWATSFAVHALAVRSRSPFLSLLPPAALMAFAGIVMREQSRPVYVVPFLLACLAVLFGDALYRVGEWGPVTVWSQGRGRRALGGVAWTKGARRVALASVGLALFAPWILPGFGAASIVDVRGAGGGSVVTIDPIVDIRPKLLNQPDVELFRVRSPRGAYWRFLALEEFNGQQWTSSDLYAQRGVEVESGPLHGTDADLPAERYRLQGFQFDAAVQPWLPAAYPAVRIELDDATVRHDPGTGTIVLPNGTYRGFSYQVTSAEVVPTPEALDVIPDLRGPAGLVALPPNTPPEIYRIARDWTAGAITPYRKVLAIQDRLRRFEYDARAPAGHDVNDMLFFLTESRAGYCEQFAGSMAVLLRALGYPARVAVGYTPGTQDERDRNLWHVSGQNAHAWVEVLFPQWGWLAFEPTPTRENPVAQPYNRPVFQDPGGPGGPAGSVAGRLAGGKEDQLRWFEGVGPDPACRVPGACDPTGRLREQTAPGVAPTGESSSRSRRLWAVGAAATLLVLGLLAIPAVKAGRRRLRLRRAVSPRELVLAVYEVMDERARDLGLGRRGGETLEEYRRRLHEVVAFSDGHLARLTSLAGRAAYAEEGVSEEQAGDALAAARQVAADMRRSRGRARTVIGWFRVERRLPGR